MGLTMKETGFSAEISKEEVFHSLRCREDSGALEAFEEEYERCRKEVEKNWEPVILLKEAEVRRNAEFPGLKAGEEVLLVLYSAGEKLSRKCAEAFSGGDGVYGIMMNTMTDSALFGLEGPLLAILKKYCEENRKGILERIEVSIEKGTELQRWIMEELEAESHGFSLTSGGMFSPVKTCALVFRMTEKENIFCATHDCASCDQIFCERRKVRSVTVTVIKGKKTEKIKAEPGETLLAVLGSRGLIQDAPCGGKGLCGKCRIQLVKGKLPVQKEEEKLLSLEEREEGWRLACLAVLQMDVTVRVPQTQEKSFQVLTAGEVKSEDEGGEKEREKEREKEGESEREREAETLCWGIAGDIGTTTLAMHSIDLETGQILDSWTGVNPQRRLGADVIARVEAAVSGKGEELRQILQKALTEGISVLMEKSRNKKGLKKAAFAGNTVMLHLLRGYDCKGLAQAPFHPSVLEMEELTLCGLAGEGVPDIPVRLLPGISAFIGADVTAGIYAQNMQEMEGPRLLIDLGTNGEMVLGDKKGFLCASVPAGPALEGGSLTWGMGSVAGAIQGVEIKNGKTRLRSVQDAPPEGICGSGAIETVAELVREGMLDETGLLEEKFFEEGFPLGTTPDGRRIVLTQKDIREIQLAKGAVRAGIEMLLKEAGVQAEEVRRIFLAGGLGVSMNPEKLFAIGMLPKGFRGRMKAAGNAALKGCIRCLMEEDAEKKLRDIVKKSRELTLSSNQDFQERFIENMGFGEKEEG